VPRSMLYLSVVVLLVFVKIISIFYHKFDPFLPFENLFSALFFGGLLDAFKKAGNNQQQQANSGSGRHNDRESSYDPSGKSNENDGKSKDNKKKD
jgi:trimeric intracellular cation channel